MTIEPMQQPNLIIWFNRKALTGENDISFRYSKTY